MLVKIKNAVVSGIAKSVNEKLVNYKEHIYLAQDIINVAPEIKEKVIFIAENYPSALITKMVDLPVEVLEEMMEKYEKEKPQG